MEPIKNHLNSHDSSPSATRSTRSTEKRLAAKTVFSELVTAWHVADVDRCGWRAPTAVVFFFPSKLPLPRAKIVGNSG